MELLCHRSRGTKAFKGKGEVLSLARDASARMEELAGEMRRLSRTSKRAYGGGFHYLDLHRRPTRSGEACCLRWRSPLHRHMRWIDVAIDVQRLAVGLHAPYREMNRKACELNALYGLYRAERTTLERLARAYEDQIGAGS